MQENSELFSDVLEGRGIFVEQPLHEDLPSPAEVRVKAIESKNPAARSFDAPPPIRFPSLGLIVKYGASVSVSEARCQILVRAVLSPQVPVPEVYGWCTDRGQTFIYMEFIEGATLEKQWDHLSNQERTSICAELRHMVNSWRALTQCNSTSFIGHVDGQPLLDTVFTSTFSPAAGPFRSVAHFHNWYTVFRPRTYTGKESPHPYRSGLPDDVSIVFTHADLHPSNILLSHGSDPHIIGIIDWEQSGWYPEYWEYCKARWTAKIDGEWEVTYLPQFLKSHACYDYWDYFVVARGA